MSTTNSPAVDIQEVFKSDLKIEAKVMAIETLFANERRTKRTDYKPSYQRNYVWDDDKATYFIESILLGTEIPPIIFFNSSEKIEVIDGRQRYETIKRFIDKDFKLKKKGLLKLKDLSNKSFDDLGDLKDTFWDTKLRIIEFSFRDQADNNSDKEEIVKKEIFKRYNSGITPLKSVEIDKAKYLNNGINKYFKKRISANKNIQKDLSDVFFFEAPFDIDKVLKKIRQLLVQPAIPITYYANTSTKQAIIERFFEFMSASTDDVEDVYIKFIEKLSILKGFKKYFDDHNLVTNKLVFECLLWAISIIEKEDKSLSILLEEDIRQIIYEFISENIISYSSPDSNFYPKIIGRYSKTSQLFKTFNDIDFDLYLTSSAGFKEKNKETLQIVTDSTSLSKFESLRLNKPDASSNAIDDICTRMQKERFLIRPPYQRKEVIERYKSSAIIESILLGIKLPPIFLYKRNDGVAEVIDGQQRLLSILGYLGRTFLDENKRIVFSKKNEYSLRRLNILKKDIEGKKFANLPSTYQDRILDFDLWIIEINEKNNPDFDPIDLFIRLNYKPFPILENTFEMWNSYVDREIIDKIKGIYAKHKQWFYVRRDNRRMDNEGLLTSLSFLEYATKESNKVRIAPSNLDIYRSSNKLSIRVTPKSEITSVLDDASKKTLFLTSCANLEASFISKVKELISNSENDSGEELRLEFDNLLGVSNKLRTFQSIYACWYILLNISIESIQANKTEIRSFVSRMIKEMKNTKDVESFKAEVNEFRNKHN